jgi:hypothetical protein
MQEKFIGPLLLTIGRFLMLNIFKLKVIIYAHVIILIIIKYDF